MENKLDSNTIQSRYASIRFGAGLSKKAFAESLGIHPVVSGDIELGKRDPSREVLVRLARVWNVDINWLLTGKEALKNTSAANHSDQDTGDTVLVDLFDQEAAAGRGAEIDAYAEMKRIPVPRSLISPRKGDRVRAVEVRGDSMTGIGLDNGDIVLFASDERTGDGVHVVSVGNMLLVKRVHFDPAGRQVHLISENPRYEPRVLEGGDLDEFRVEGRVIGWMHRY